MAPTGFSSEWKNRFCGSLLSGPLFCRNAVLNQLRPHPRRNTNVKITSSAISGAEATLSSTEMIGVGTAAESSAICQPTIQEVSYRPVRTFERPMLANVAATLLVPVYRLFSVAILSAILIGLASYLFLTIFYFFSQGFIHDH